MKLNSIQYSIYKKVADVMDEMGFPAAVDYMTDQVRENKLLAEDCAAVLQHLLLLVG